MKCLLITILISLTLALNKDKNLTQPKAEDPQVDTDQRTKNNDKANSNVEEFQKISERTSKSEKSTGLMKDLDKAKEYYQDCAKKASEEKFNSKLASGSLKLKISEKSLDILRKETNNLYKTVANLTRKVSSPTKKENKYSIALESCRKAAKKFYYTANILERKLKNSSESPSTPVTPTTPTNPVPPVVNSTPTTPTNPVPPVVNPTPTTSTNPVPPVANPNPTTPANSVPPVVNTTPIAPILTLPINQACKSGSRNFACTVPENTPISTASVEATDLITGFIYSCEVSNGKIGSCNQLYLDTTQACIEDSIPFSCTLPAKTPFSQPLVIATKNDGTTYLCVIQDGVIIFCNREYLPQEHICNNGTTIFACTTPKDTFFNQTTVIATKKADNTTYICPLTNGLLDSCKLQFMLIDQECDSKPCKVPPMTPADVGNVVATTKDGTTYYCKVVDTVTDDCEIQYLTTKKCTVGSDIFACTYADKTLANSTSVDATLTRGGEQVSCTISTPSYDLSCTYVYLKTVTTCQDTTTPTPVVFNCTVPIGTPYLKAPVTVVSHSNQKTYICSTNDNDGTLSACDAVSYFDEFTTCSVSGTGGADFDCIVPPKTSTDNTNYNVTSYVRGLLYKCTAQASGKPSACTIIYVDTQQYCYEASSNFPCTVNPFTTPGSTVEASDELTGEKYTCPIDTSNGHRMLYGSAATAANKCSKKYYSKSQSTCVMSWDATLNGACTFNAEVAIVASTASPAIESTLDSNGLKLNCIVNAAGSTVTCYKYYFDTDKTCTDTNSNSFPCKILPNTPTSLSKIFVTNKDTGIRYLCTVGTYVITANTCEPTLYRLAKKYEETLNKYDQNNNNNNNNKSKLRSQKNMRNAKST